MPRKCITRRSHGNLRNLKLIKKKRKKLKRKLRRRITKKAKTKRRMLILILIQSSKNRLLTLTPKLRSKRWKNSELVPFSGCSLFGFVSVPLLRLNLLASLGTSGG